MKGPGDGSLFLFSAGLARGVGRVGIMGIVGLVRGVGSVGGGVWEEWGPVGLQKWD